MPTTPPLPIPTSITPTPTHNPTISAQHSTIPTYQSPTPTHYITRTSPIPTPTSAVIAMPNKPIVQQFNLETILEVSNTVAKYYPVEE